MAFLEVALPAGVAVETESYGASGIPRAHLGIVLQVYDNPANQAAIAKLCALFASGAGLRLIGAEAADQALTREPGNTDIGKLLQSKMVSAGVLSLFNGGRPEVDVHGVDDVSLIPPSHQAMMTVSAARDLRDRVYGQVRLLLTTAHIRHGKPHLAAARAGRYEVYGARQPLKTQARALEAAASESVVPLGSFPRVTRFLEMAALETRLDLTRVAAEQEQFLRRIMSLVGRWDELDTPEGLQRLEPLIDYWLAETGQTASEFRKSLEGPNPAAPLIACRRWYSDWVRSLAANAQRPDFMEGLMRFALRTGLPYFELRAFRQHVASQRDAEQLKHGLDDEIEDLHRTIADAQSGACRSVIDAEQRLDILYRLLQLAVPPGHAAVEAGAAGTVREAVEELAGLAEQPIGAGLTRDLDALDPPRRAALDFLDHSRRRSRHMVEQMLELLDSRHEDRALLVVGGFHAKAITTALEDYPDVSWAVFMPAVDVAAGWQAHRSRF